MGPGAIESTGAIANARFMDGFVGCLPAITGLLVLGAVLMMAAAGAPVTELRARRSSRRLHTRRRWHGSAVLQMLKFNMQIGKNVGE
jgi:hypothetical protein